ncbi:hypothetical protein L1987_07863 [Smallanthus sonchifolius]|uniref:Uncharacterized protein n=1 Tax=Smallanthus sonchifolius TaxID=185202 RepID=A0ACB9JK56_9ASTR|nr:hypothetical protein L1987_07863 [Smallanthus sonchifolius]
MILFTVPPNRICKKVKYFYRFMSISSSSLAQSLDITEENNHHSPDYVELRRNMHNLATSGNIDQSLHFFNFMRKVPGKPTIYDYNALLNCYLKSKNVCLHDISALQLEMMRLQLQPNLPTFNTLLKGLNLVGESKVALWVIMIMCKYGFALSFSSLSTLLRKFLDSMELVDAMNVLELMLEFDYVPTEPKAILLVNSLSKHGMIQDGCFVFFKLLGKGYFQSPYFYNPILWSLCKSDQTDGALALFCCVKKKGLVHNECSYTALVYGLCKRGLFCEAFRCLKVMEAESGCYLNAKTYTTIIKCLCDYGRVNESLCLLGEMEKKGCEPDIVTYNIVLRALSQKNMVLEIHDLYETLYEKGISPDRYTATAVSGLLKRGSLGIARNCIRDIVSSGIKVDVAVYNVYLSCLCYAREPGELLSFHRSMIQDGIEPNNITFNTILKCFCEEKTFDEAIEFFEWVKWPEKRPDLVSFNTILSSACKLGDSSMVQRVVDLMENKGVKLNVVGFTCLMQYFGNVGNVSDCLKVFEHMILYGPHPSVVTVNTLMVSLCKNHELEAAYQVFSNLKSYGLAPDSRTYNILMQAAKNQREYFLLADLERKCMMEKRSQMNQVQKWLD